MAKKPVAKKKKAQPAAQRRKSGSSNISVKGGIHAGRDVIMHDQINTYNDLRQQVAQIATPAEFLARAQEVQQQIATLKQQPELAPVQVKQLELAEAEVQDAARQAQQDKPVGQRINETLTSAQETMDKLAKGVTAAVGLGTVIGGLGQIAIKLFGG